MSTGSWCFPWSLEVASVCSATRPTSPTCSWSTPGPSSPASPCSPTGQRTEPPRASTWRPSPGTQEQLRSWQAAQNTDRVLATVLFTDIVGSTQQAAALGDQGWRRLLDRHDRVARTEVERFRGRLVKSTGDGTLATFDAPTRALRCAFGLNAGLGDFGLTIRSAIHTGEIEFRDDDIGGIGAHIAARVLAQAVQPARRLGFAEFPVSGSCSLLRLADIDDPERPNAASVDRSQGTATSDKRYRAGVRDLECWLPH